MKKTWTFGVVLLLMVGFAAAAYSQPDGGSYIIPAKDPNGKVILDPRTHEPTAEIDWTTQVITAKGGGVPPAGTTGPQGKLMACRAAALDARRNLLETIKGMPITSETLAVNYVTQDDRIRTKIEGIVKATTLTENTLADGTCEVSVRLGIHEVVLGQGSLTETLLPAKPGPAAIPPPIGAATPPPVGPWTPPPVAPGTPAAIATPVPVMAAVYSGIVVDARSLDARPAMSPRLLDSSGQEIYGSAYVTREYAVQNGMAGYSRSLEAAMMNERVTATPLQVKAVKASGAAKADIVLSEDDAAKLRSASKTQSFLSQARVMIVLD